VKPRIPGLAFASSLILAACSGGAASSSSLQAQSQAASSPSTSSGTLSGLLCDQMLQAQMLCTTSLTYRPCGLVAGADTVNCFILCQGQIVSGAANLMERGARDCAVQAPVSADAGSPSCEFQLADESPVDVVQLRAGCNARCRELQADGGAVAAP